MFGRLGLGFGFCVFLASLHCTGPSRVTASGAAADSVGDASAPDGPIVYVARDDGTIDAFQEGTWANVGHWSGLPFTDGVRGVEVDPTSGTLFVAHGSTGPDPGPGSLLAFSLYDGTTRYDVAYPHGIDQPAYGDGVLYMPSGEAATVSLTYLVDPATGAEMGSQPSSKRPHNTLYRNGHVYSGGMGDRYLVVHGIGAGKIGPVPTPRYGVRPFTVNADESRAYITWSGYRGFSVGDVQSGAILTSISFGDNTTGNKYAGLSHGISLSPDGSELYVLDMIENQVRVYDASDAPTLRATLDLAVPIYPGEESPCAHTCDKSGWLLHTRDGKYVLVGDSGDVIDTSSRAIVANIEPLRNTRHGFIEVDWAGGKVTATGTRFGMGY